MHRSASHGKNDPGLVRKARQRGQESRSGRSGKVLLVAVLLVVALAAGVGWRQTLPARMATTSAAATGDPDAVAIGAPTGEVDEELASPSAHTEEAESDRQTEIQAWGPADPYDWETIEIRKGDNLHTALVANGIVPNEAERLVHAIAEVYDVRRVMPGNSIDLRVFGARIIAEAIFRPSRLDEVHIRLVGNRLVAEKLHITPDISIQGVRVKVVGSLYESFQRANLSGALLFKAAGLFGWAIDFSHDVREGDTFDLLWEKLEVRHQPWGTGQILAARYQGSAVHSSYFLFPEKDHDRWYHPDGRNVAADFLRSPVHFSHISSHFSRSRLHPVLGIYRPHSGVDFAAPTGTPVMAAADGTVVGAGRMGGAGLSVRLRHRNGWITSYSHLSRILTRPGQKVRQKQTIGLVGATGLASGPHLDYRIKIAGRFVDPLKITLPMGEKIPQRQLARFRQRVEQLEKQLDEAVATSAVDTADAAKYTKEP